MLLPEETEKTYCIFSNVFHPDTLVFSWQRTSSKGKERPPIGAIGSDQQEEEGLLLHDGDRVGCALSSGDLLKHLLCSVVQFKH